MTSLELWTGLWTNQLDNLYQLITGHTFSEKLVHSHLPYFVIKQHLGQGAAEQMNCELTQLHRSQPLSVFLVMYTLYQSGIILLTTRAKFYQPLLHPFMVFSVSS